MAEDSQPGEPFPGVTLPIPPTSVDVDAFAADVKARLDPDLWERLTRRLLGLHTEPVPRADRDPDVTEPDPGESPAEQLARQAAQYVAEHMEMADSGDLPPASAARLRALGNYFATSAAETIRAAAEYEAIWAMEYGTNMQHLAGILRERLTPAQVQELCAWLGE